MACASIPTCFFPSTVLFISNEQEDWLKSIFVGNMRFTSSVVGSASDALIYMQDQCCKSEQLSGLCTDHSVLAHAAPEVVDSCSHDLVMLHAEMYNPQRFAEVSVVVFDSALLTSGLVEFCYTLTHHASKKIALISRADETEAKLALDSGLIDDYIIRDESGAYDTMLEKIYAAQEKYFQCMSALVLKVLDMPEPECLNNSEFVLFFNELCVRYNIVEYYLFDISGGFLLLNADGQVSSLLHETYIPQNEWYDANYQKSCSYQHYLNEIYAEDCLLAS